MTSEIERAVDHVSIEELADHAEGLLSAERAETVSTHVAGCSDCAKLAAALKEVSATLAAEPLPKMPLEVQQRLAGVISSEATRRANGEARAAEEAQQAAAAKRTALGSFGQNPGYADKVVRVLRHHPVCDE